jgi:hypothetical protein
MSVGKMVLACIAGCAALLSVVAGARADDCKEPEFGTKDAPMLSPPLGAVVTGTGRLQFYSAPKFGCAMKGVFVIPKDQLVEYVRTDDGWSQVMYAPRNRDDVSGWVRSDRLKETGTEGPKQ